MTNPYTKKGCLKVEDYFLNTEVRMPFCPEGAFESIQQMLSTFDDPDKLEIIAEYGVECLKLKEKIASGYAT